MFTHVWILQAVCIIRIQVVFPTSLRLEFNLTFVRKRLKSHKNSMDPATEGKSLKNNLKKAAWASAYTLTPATGYLGPNEPRSNAPINSKLQHLPPRAYPGHLTVHRARGGGNLNFALEGWGI